MAARRKEKVATGIIVIFALAASLLMVVFIGYHAPTIEVFIRRIGFLGPLVSILLYAILSTSPIPSDPLSLINGAVFGPVLGTLISWVGNMVAAMIEYFIGQKLGNLADFEHRRQNLPWGLSKFPADSAWFLFLGRFIPEFGGKIVSLVGGMYKVPLWKYIWTAAVSTLLGSLLFAALGFGLVKLF